MHLITDQPNMFDDKDVRKNRADTIGKFHQPSALPPTKLEKIRARNSNHIVENGCLDTDQMIEETTIASNVESCQCRCCSHCQEQHFFNEHEETKQSCCSRKSAANYDNQLSTETKVNQDHRNREHVLQSSTKMSEQCRHSCLEKSYIDSTTAKLVSVQNINCTSTFSILSRNLIIIFVINSLLSHLIHLQQNHHRLSANKLKLYTSTSSSIFVHAQESTDTNAGDHCVTDYDCKDGERICHENKCMCPRDQPVEDKERSLCLPLALINEQCYSDNQCLSDSKCIEGMCACGPDYISLYNPSTKVYYCHPKRHLNEDCNHDTQCPENAFCSTKKHGCLCLNGYGAALVKNNGAETYECLPKACTASADCESEYHICDENKCKCLATHFDPHTALCYKFGSTGGKPDGDTASNATSMDNGDAKSSLDGNNNNNIHSLFEDLTKNGDRMWPIIVGLIVLTILLLALMICLVRKYCLGYCWTAHKKEYEPNNKNSAKNGQNFNKNSINNKSFRQKKGEIDEEDEEENNNVDDEVDNTAADRSNLMKTTAGGGGGNNNNIGKGGGKKTSRSPFKINGVSHNSKNSGGNGSIGGDNPYVKVDISNSYSNENGNQKYPTSTNDHHYQPFHQVLNQPLASSTSTPV